MNYVRVNPKELSFPGPGQSFNRICFVDFRYRVDSLPLFLCKTLFSKVR